MRCFDAECYPGGNNRCRGKLNGSQFNGIGPFYEIIAAQNMTAEHQRTNADQHIATGQTEIFFYTQQVHTGHPKKHGQPYQPGTFLFEQK